MKELTEQFYVVLMYDELDEYEDVINYLSEYIKNNPKDSIALNNRGLAFAEIGKIKEAFSDLKMSIKIKPNETTPYRNICDLFMFQNQFTEAIKYYTTALEINKGESTFYKLRAECFEKIGEIELANLDHKEAEKLQV